MATKEIIGLDDTLIYLNDKVMRAKDGEEKAFYLFQKLMIAAFVDAMDACVKVVPEPDLITLRVVAWLAKLYANCVLQNFNPETIEEAMTYAADTFRDALMESAEHYQEAYRDHHHDH